MVAQKEEEPPKETQKVSSVDNGIGNRNNGGNKLRAVFVLTVRSPNIIDEAAKSSKKTSGLLHVDNETIGVSFFTRQAHLASALVHW